MEDVCTLEDSISQIFGCCLNAGIPACAHACYVRRNLLREPQLTQRGGVGQMAGRGPEWELPGSISHIHYSQTVTAPPIPHHIYEARHSH